MRQIEVVAAIFYKDNQILSTQRGYGEFKGKWEFPGGKMEPGETQEETLHREIREELETEINVEKFLVTTQYQYPNFFLTMHCYLCTIKSGALLLKEHEAMTWVGQDTIDSLDWLPADAEVIEAIKKEFNWT